MPKQIAIHGVLVPVIVALAAVALVLVAEALWRRFDRPVVARPSRSRRAVAWLHGRLDGARVMAPAVAIAFALSFHARQGVRWPPASAWEWLAPAVAAVALVAWLVPGRAGILIGSLAAGAATAWALALPGFKEWPWRLGLGSSVFVLSMILSLAWRSDRHERSSRGIRVAELAAVAIAFGGLAAVVIASGFEKLTTTLMAIAFTLAGAALLATLVSRLRLGSASAAPLSMLLVGAAAVAASYGADDFPFWHWPVAAAAPLAALAVSWPSRWWGWRPAMRAIMQFVAVAIIAIGNAAAALGPLIARGDFPPK